MGLVTAGTTTFYYLSLLFIPASVAITLLFQFTWIGLVFEVATTRRRPTNAALLAAVVVCVGTLFASGLLGGAGTAALHPLGIACGLAAAVCCAGFMFLSGRVETQVPVQQRGLWACCGYVVVGFALCPDYLSSGVLARGIGWYGLVLGPLGFAVPMMLFGMACKHLSPGLSTIDGVVRTAHIGSVLGVAAARGRDAAAGGRRRRHPGRRRGGTGAPAAPKELRARLAGAANDEPPPPSCRPCHPRWRNVRWVTLRNTGFPPFAGRPTMGATTQKGVAHGT